MNPQMSFEELDVVQLLPSLPTRHGPIPVGTIGTIVSNYGDPDSDDWEFLQQYSPYHNVQDAPGVGDVHNGHRYPPALWITSTRDDRVHPAHARKMTALLRAAGQDVAYYENIEGGHSAAADNAQQ